MAIRILSVCLLLSVMIAGVEPAYAGGAPARALEPLAESIFHTLNTPRRRFAIETFLKTAEGRAIARRAEINSVEDLAERLAAEEAAAFGGELEAQLRKIDGALDDFRRYRREAGHPIEGQALTRLEKELVKFLVKRYLKINSADDVLRQLLPRQHQFFQAAVGNDLNAARKAFVQQEPTDAIPINSTQITRPAQPVPAPTPAAARAANKDVQSWFTRIRGCIRDRANGTHGSQVGAETDRAYLWQGLFVNTSLAGVGYVTSVGTKNVDFSDLSTDLMMTIASTTVGAKIMAGRMKLKTRWMRILMFGSGRSVVDGVVYKIDPVDQIVGEPGEEIGHSWEDTFSRGQYSASYNILSSPKSIGTYLLFNGIMDCFPGNRAVQVGVAGLRALENVGSTFLFFHARQWWMERD